MPREQRQIVMQQIAQALPRAPQPDNRPPAPSVVVKPEPKGLKPGFLLSDGIDKSKKKNTKNKKHDEVVTLSDVGASEDEEPVATDITDADA